MPNEEREMKTKLLAGLMTMALSPMLMAAPKSAKAQSQIKLKRHAPVLNQASSQERKDKKVTINASVMGITHNTLSRSLEAGYHLNADTVLSLQYSDLQSGLATTDEGKYSNDELNTWLRNGVGSSISTGGKRFLSNSFYIKAEAYYRNQDHINKTGSKKSTANGEWMVVYKETARIEDMGATLKIGNQWQWDNFTLGCDWIGANKSLSILSQRGKVEDNDLNSVSLLNFYLGASF